MSDVEAANAGSVVAMPGRARRRLERRRPPWMAALAVTLAGHFSLRGSLTRSMSGVRSPIGRLAVGALVVFGLGTWEVSAFYFLRFFHFAMVLAGQPYAIPLLMLVATQLLVLIAGTAFAISALFFSKDVPRLMPLPLRPGEIMAVRFTTLYADVLLVSLLFVPPALAAAASRPPDPATLQGAASLFEPPVRLSADWTYWLSGVWLTLAMPAAPLAVATLVAVGAGRTAAVSRYRDALYILGGLFGLAVALGYQYVNLKFMPHLSDPAQVADLLARPNAAVLQWARLYPPARWAVEALMGPSAAGALGPGMAGPGALVAGAAGVVSGTVLARLGRLGAFTLFSLVVMVPAFWAAQRWYLYGVQAGLEEPVRRRRAAAARCAEAAFRGTLGGRARTAVGALAAREWKLLWRTPAFMLPAVMNTLVPPLLLLMMAVLSPAELGPLPSLLRPEWLAAGIAGISIFMAGAGQVASTSVSREGGGFELMAALPAGPAQQVVARLLVAAPFAALSVVLVTVAAWWVFHPPLGALALGAAGGLLGCWPALAGGLWIDLLRPNTRWDNPQQAMKGNINSLWSVLVGIGLVLAAGGAGFAVMRLGGSFGWALAIGAAVLAALGALLTWLSLKTTAIVLANAGELGG